MGTLLWKLRDHMNVLLHMSRRSIVRVRVERENAEPFAFQQETLNVLCLSLLAAKRNEQGNKPLTLFGSLDECNLERYLISQCLRRKMCEAIVFERSRGASGWPGSEAGRSCWNRGRSPDTLDTGRMWPMRLWPSAVTVTVMLNIT